MTLNLTFHGAAGCVTGSCARLETDKAVVLIDCGMFQGSKTLKALNYEPFPFEVEQIDAVLLTHAHIDHSGLIPKLTKAGYEGPVYATATTRDLCEIMLADAGGIQESEVEHLNRRNQRRGRPPVEPIYRAVDAAKAMKSFRKVKLGDVVQVAPGITAIYWEAGHILGAASIEVIVETDEGPVRILFSGDIGPGGRDYSQDPDGPAGVDHLVLESTYGDRERKHIDPTTRRKMLADELNAARKSGGPMLIPAFAVERSQELLADILTLIETEQVPPVDIFLDSPLAIKATKIFVERGWNAARDFNPFQDVRASERLRFLDKPWDSDTLDKLTGWHIILAGSGMCDAGRIRKHLKRWLWNRQATVLLAGYQATGTLGRLLADGADRVRIQGDDIRVAAHVRILDVYSGHADAKALADWAVARGPVSGTTFLAHGEPPALEALKERLTANAFVGAHIEIADLDSTYRLSRSSARLTKDRPPRIRAPAASSLDWHNSRARLLIELENRLDHATSDADREALIAQLGAALSGIRPG